MKIFLNPHDVNKMRLHQGLDSNQQLLELGMICLDRGQQGLILPRIQFKSFEGISFCPFLENRLNDQNHYQGLCLLHPDRKPLVCALAPLAREVDLKKEQKNFYFQKPIEDCPGCNIEKSYEWTELFPQLENELQLEIQYYAELSLVLDHREEPASYLKRLFNLEYKR